MMDDELDLEALRSLRSGALKAKSARDPKRQQALLIEIGLAEPEPEEDLVVAGPVAEDEGEAEYDPAMLEMMEEDEEDEF